MLCNLCPRKCGTDRKSSTGFCGMGQLPVVAKAFLHMWEEPCISGTEGSGTVFFSGCNLKCVYCQNYAISQQNLGREITLQQLERIFLSLQSRGAHNINLVNPTHFVPQIRQCLSSIQGLRIPVVYNTNAYDSVEALKSLEGLVDVYLPDLKYFSPEVSARYSGAEDYYATACEAILEMYRQVGPPVFDDGGIIRRGLIVRHLVLPGLVKESFEVLRWIRQNLPSEVFVSVMSQYIPFYRAECHPEISRRLTRREYDRVVDHFVKLGFENGYVQERSSAEEEYVPDFNLEGIDV